MSLLGFVFTLYISSLYVRDPLFPPVYFFGVFRVCPVLTHFILLHFIIDLAYFTIWQEEQSFVLGQPSPSEETYGFSATFRQLQFTNKVK